MTWLLPESSDVPLPTSMVIGSVDCVAMPCVVKERGVEWMQEVMLHKPRKKNGWTSVPEIEQPKRRKIKVTEKWGIKSFLKFAFGVFPRCQYCDCLLRSPFLCLDNSASVDHKTPRCRGGTNAWSNLAICCRSCNSEKDNQEWEVRFGPKNWEEV